LKNHGRHPGVYAALWNVAPILSLCLMHN
jgi:hypothetical protein